MKITFLASGTVNSNFTYRVLQLSRALHIRGHEVMIIAPSADKYNNFVFEKVDIIDGVKIFQPFQFKTHRLEINLLPYLFHTAYTLLRNRTDLIYIYKPTPISIIGLVSKFFYKTPVMLDMDDLGSEVMKIEGHPKYQQKLVAWCEHLAAKHANRVVVASTYLRDMYQKQFPFKPIYVMPNGADASWFKDLEYSKEKKRIVFMGAMNRQNILEPLFDVLPELLKKHSDLTVLIIGDGKYLSYFKKKALNLSINHAIIFTGWLPINEAYKHLYAGDIGYNYMPNEITIKAASNMKVAQYMARGMVPIVSDVGDLPAFVDSGKAGYIAQPSNLIDLKDQMLFAIDDEERLVKAQRAQIFAHEHFKWDLLTEQFEEWLTKSSIE